MAWRRAAGKRRLAAANERAMASELSSNGIVYSCNFIAEVGPSGGSSRREWMEMERELRKQDSDSEDSDSQHVVPSNLRTDRNYDCTDGIPWRNLRYVKWGPKGGERGKGYAEVVAAGPPLEELRRGDRQCWLCNASLKEHKRKWTRPGWTRKIGWSRPVGPYERVENKDNVTIWQLSKEKVVARYWRLTEEPPSQLDMTIYCCPNGCDADDALQVLLEQTDHTHVQ